MEAIIGMSSASFEFFFEKKHTLSAEFNTAIWTIKWYLAWVNVRGSGLRRKQAKNHGRWSRYKPNSNCRLTEWLPKQDRKKEVGEP